jgi:hypothetical protein
MKAHDKDVLCSQVSDYVKFRDTVCEKFESVETDFIKVFK